MRCPAHLLIVGGSYVGLEFAQMYRRFGSEVTVVEMGRAADRARGRGGVGGDQGDSRSRGHHDPAQREVRRRPPRRRRASRCRSIATQEPREIVGTHLLLATGRRPNTDDLGCERAGIALDERGYIVVDDELRTSVDGIWALGDVNGRGAFTHTAYNDYEIVAANLLDGESRRVSDRIPAYALFIDPPLGRAGMTEREARASGKKCWPRRCRCRASGRASERGETAGFMKVLVDAETKRILGAALLGIEGDEVIHSLLDVMYANAPYTLIERAMHIHPTVTELRPDAARPAAAGRVTRV